MSQVAEKNNRIAALSTSPSSDLFERLRTCRRLSNELAAPLSDEDQVVQAMDDASPTKWHLAHTTWFFEVFILRDHLPNYQSFDPAFDYCFNSYYEQKGARHPRAKRGLLTRPSAHHVRNFREHVDIALDALSRHVANLDPTKRQHICELIELGINHEQQHQELLLTDILALFSRNPLRPAYQQKVGQEDASPKTDDEVRWVPFPRSLTHIGHDGNGFHYDNEGPRHEALIHPFQIADRLVTNAEWLAFMADGGYRTATLWLSDGWACVQANNWQSPEYWERQDNTWQQMTLNGLQPIDRSASVSHVSFYEADAFARWAGARLPTEFEWECATQKAKTTTPNTLGTGRLAPCSANQQTAPPAETPIQQMFGDVWEWTASAYLPYPGYRPPEGAVGEYNGKFMCNQHVLRGASALTVCEHSRPTYRNFFYPQQRWQMTGLRLAKDVS